MAGIKRKSSSFNSPKKTPKPKKTRVNDNDNDNETKSDFEFSARVVPRKYQPARGEVVKDFSDLGSGKSIVTQCYGFFKDYTKVAITNGDVWDALNRYQKAIYRGITFQVGDDVFFRHDEDIGRDVTKMADELRNNWVGRIIEIRAPDSDNVRLLINWYNRPEDLPGPRQRQPHHGSSEVIATNDVDIQKPESIDGLAKVLPWEESTDDAAPEKAIFWRQAAAVEDPKRITYSGCKKECVCNQPANPDKALLHCDKCDLWLHDECLVQDLAEAQQIKSWQRVVDLDEDGNETLLLPKTFKLTPIKGKPWTVTVDDGRNLFVSDDKNRGSSEWSEKILCLKCKQWLAGAEEEA